MDSADKLLATFIICLGVAAVMMIGWGASISLHNHNFDIECIKAGKTIQYRTLEGNNTPMKECK